MRETTLRSRAIARRRILAAFMMAGVPTFASAICNEFNGFWIHQCGHTAWFAPVPDPNFGLAHDPSDPNRVTNIKAVFWQIGFGNERLNTGQSSAGTGMSGITMFNGNDQGIRPPDLADARRFLGDQRIPEGSICLRSNNWAHLGIDGCCDNQRTLSLEYANDDFLNPYFDVYYAHALGYVGRYSLLWQQDYPMAILLKEPSGRWFAFAAIATLSRGNTGGGQNGPCHPASPGPNPAPCSTSPGSYSFGEISNGLQNPMTGRLNVIPWQAAPHLQILSDELIDPGDPDSERLVSLTWPSVVIHSDLSVRPSANPMMGGAEFSPGVGVMDVASRFGLVRYRLETSDFQDPNFLHVTRTFETAATSTEILIPDRSCLRMRTLLGKKPRSTSHTVATCRVGACGDVGYEVASERVCFAGACEPVPEVCDGLDNDCDLAVDDGDPGGGAPCFTGSVGECAQGTVTCTGGALRCLGPAPNADACDGLDNDCDGAVDEGNPGGGLICSTGRPGECATGMTACLSGAISCEPISPHIGPTDACDGRDNDCDRSVDEDAEPQGPCATGAPGVCSTGSSLCRLGRYECVQTVTPSAEICDGLDNDCDRVVDEGDPGGGGGCDLGPCGHGTLYCIGGGLACLPTPFGFPPDDPTCDGVDDNCNGIVDEDAVPLGPCDTGIPGICGPGVLLCRSARYTCVQALQPAPESCDRLDNDCDGAVDEGAVAVEAAVSINPATINVNSRGNGFTLDVALTNVCDDAAPVPMDPALLERTRVSRTGTRVFPEPMSLPCPGPGGVTAFETGIFENFAERTLHGDTARLRFNLASDGHCATLDGDRQELITALSEVPDDTDVPVCLSGRAAGAAFEACALLRVRRTGNP